MGNAKVFSPLKWNLKKKEKEIKKNTKQNNNSKAQHSALPTVKKNFFRA